MKKATILAISFTFLVSFPAAAQLGELWSDFQSYAGDLQNYLSNNLSENLRPLESETQGAINNSTGTLNIPNPIAAGQTLRDGLVWLYVTDKFENNATVKANLVGNEVNRLITRGAAASVLGTNGQLRLKSKLEQTERSINRIDNFSNRAEEIQNEIETQVPSVPDITGRIGEGAVNAAANAATGGLANLLTSLLSNIQLQQVRVQQEQAKISGETLGQTIQTNQLLLYSNLNLASISEQVEETNRARRVDTSAEAARLLRTSSQVDLFGRETE